MQLLSYAFQAVEHRGTVAALYANAPCECMRVVIRPNDASITCRERRICVLAQCHRILMFLMLPVTRTF